MIHSSNNKWNKMLLTKEVKVLHYRICKLKKLKVKIYSTSAYKRSPNAFSVKYTKAFNLDNELFLSYFQVLFKVSFNEMLLMLLKVLK